MDGTGIIRFSGHLDPRAQEFRPRISSSQNQITFLQPQIYYSYPFSYPSTGVHVIPFYDGRMGHQSSAAAAYVRPINANPPPPPPPPPPPSAAASRALLLSSVPADVSEATVRRELEVFGEVRAVLMERLQEGIVTVHFYDLRHAQAAMAEIREQHMLQQSRLRQHYNALFNQNLWFEGENLAAPPPPPACGLIAGRAVWAQFTVPGPIVGPDGHNQGTLVVFNLDSEVSSSKLRELFEVFGPVKELREAPLKRHQRFVEFFDIRDAARALSEINGKEIHGKHLVVEFSRPGGHGRKFFNATAGAAVGAPNTAAAPNINWVNGINHDTSNATYPLSKSPLPVAPRLFSHSSSDDLPCRSSQNQPPDKKFGFIRENANCNRRSNYGRGGAAAPFDSLSLSVFGNGNQGEKNYNASSRSNTRNNNNNGYNPLATTKQPRSQSWKGRHKSSDAQFQINEDAIVKLNCRDFRTTVMIKNIPNKYSQKLLLNMLDNHCLHCNEQISEGDGQLLSSYDFVYLPIDFNNKCNVGYGFVNLTSPQATLRFYKAFHMQPWEVFNSRKICEVTYARLQGLKALKEHFKNSKFACETDEYLPVVFSPPRDGKQLTEPMAIGGHPKFVNKKLVGICNGRARGDGLDAGGSWNGVVDDNDNDDDEGF